MMEKNYSISRQILTDSALRKGILYGLLSSFIEACGYGILIISVQWMSVGRDTLSMAAMILIGLITIFGIQSLFLAAGLVQNFTGIYRVMARIRIQIMDHLLDLPDHHPLLHPRTHLIELMTSRYAAIQEIFSRLWSVIIPSIALPILLLAMTAWLCGLAALILLLSLPLIAGIMIFAFRLLDKADAGLALAQKTFTEATLNFLEGQNEIRFFDPTGQIALQAKNASDQLQKKQMLLEQAPAPAIIGYAFIAQSGMALAIIAIVYNLQHHFISAGAAFAAILIIYRFCRCVIELAGQMTGLRFARNSFHRLNDILSSSGMPQPIQALEPKDNRLHLQNISSFFNEEDHDSGGLEGIEAEILLGSKIAIVGLSGSGKTTLAHLLLGLKELHSGSITLGGVDLRHIARQKLVKCISLVPQNIHLFEASLADNIRLGCPNASDQQVIAAAKQAQAFDFIKCRPLGLQTKIHAKETTLSGGEKQRLAIARALLMESPVLILDEATSELDINSETILRNILKDMGKDRTLFTIVHRLWIARDADEIWVMDKGRLVERGSHTSLLASGGIYARLWQSQKTQKNWTSPELDDRT